MGAGRWEAEAAASALPFTLLLEKVPRAVRVTSLEKAETFSQTERRVQRVNWNPLQRRVCRLRQKSCSFNDELAFKAVPVLWRGIPPLPAARVPRGAERSRPPALREAAWAPQGHAAREPPSACRRPSGSECPANPCKTRRAAGGASQPRGKATGSLSPLQRTLLHFLWSIC